MKYTHKSARAIAISIKPVATGAFVFVLFALSLGIFFFGKTHNAAMEDVRMAITDRLVPVVQALAKPIDTIQGIGTWAHEMAALREENQRLKIDNDRLLRWQSAATELSSENQRLRTLLKYAPAAPASYVTARIAVDAGNPYSHSVVIGAGINHGVMDDSAVVNENGLVGRIIGVGQKTARVLLLTDINSRIPVIAQNSREHAIAGGNGADTLSLLYLPESSKIKAGEIIVTSGDGNVIPAGIPVGVVTSIEKGVATLQAYADWHKLEYVRVVDPMSSH